MPNKDVEARRLADAHYAVEAGITQIFRIRGSADAEGLSDEPIKLLEINAYTIPSGIMPLHFGPATAIGVTSPSTIIEITPAEFARLQSRELQLPDGWTIADPLPRLSGSNGE
jgi:hypothetical protein